MKEIKLKFIGAGYKNLYQVFVKLYDENDNLIYIGKTYNGILKIKLIPNKVYKIKAKFLSESINATLYVKRSINKYIFIFSHSLISRNNPNERTITFLLTDLNYENLKIEKGEMYLWQKM